MMILFTEIGNHTISIMYIIVMDFLSIFFHTSSISFMNDDFSWYT